MKNVKILFIIFLTLGFILGSSFAFILSYKMKLNPIEYLIFANYFNDKIKNEYGSICYKDAEYKNVIGTIGLIKDMGLAIYEEKGVKTVRAYSCE